MTLQTWQDGDTRKSVASAPPHQTSLSLRCLRRAGTRTHAGSQPRGVSVLLALPTWASLALLLAFPFVYTIALSFTQSTLGEPFAEWAGLENFRTALTTQAFTGSLFRTVTFAVSAALIEMTLGTLLALLLQARGSGFGIIGTVLLLPMITPPIMVGVAWQLLLAPAGGGLTALWNALGASGFNAFGTGTLAFASLVLIEAWQWTPFVTLMVYVALLGVDREQIEAATLDGAGVWKRFCAVTYPAIAPVVLSVLLLRILGGFKAFDVAYVITQGGPGFATTFSTFQIFRTALDGAYDTGLAAAETLLLGIVIGIITLTVTTARKRAARVAA